MKNFKQQFGQWAIVTGASSGIGKEFAKQLAQKGMNLFLVARREELLQRLSKELSQEFGITAKYKVLDLTEETSFEQLDLAVSNYDVRLLISNAGAAHMGAFSKIPLANLENMTKLNVFAQLKLSHWFSNKLQANDEKGGIVLLSSSIAYQGTPYAANYSAAKAYILNLGEGLHHELKDKGIHVSVLVPGPTDAPGLTERTDSNMVDGLPMAPQPVNELVREGLAALEANKPYQLGGKMNRIMTGTMNRVMPRSKASAFWGKKMKEMVFLK